MKTTYKYGLLEIISQDNRDILKFNHTSGRVTFEIVYKKNGSVLIDKAYWQQSGFGGPIKGNQESLWKSFYLKIKDKLH